MTDDAYGIYVHVPWCRSRCPYCAFNVRVEAAPDYDAWAAGVAREWELRAPAFRGDPHSVYFGGGTPSLATPEAISAVLEALPRAPGAEVTLEANPGTIDAARLAAFRAVGVNRVSLGIQTFNPSFGRLLNRGHTVGQAHELAALVAEAGFRSWSVDVIFSLPGQTPADFAVDLAAILALSPPHVSLYGLSYEPGTPITRARDEGRLVPADAEDWRAMYDEAVRALQAHGLERYEVSNFARPGHRAVHNEAVWRGGFYAGLGPGAHGFEPDGHRTVSCSEPAEWLRDPEAERSLPTPEEAATDLVLSTLRHRDGLPTALLAARTGHRVRAGRLDHLVRGGWLAWAGPDLRLTEAAWPIADGLVARVAAALTPIR